MEQLHVCTVETGIQPYANVTAFQTIRVKLNFMIINFF